MRWKILKELPQDKKLDSEEIIRILLENRGINKEKEIQEFLNPIPPDSFLPKDLGIGKEQLNKAIKRIKRAIQNKETIIVYGDYDADGICATAILWEALFSLTKKTLPYIPERVSEGYGLNKDTLKKLKSKFPDLGLIITVDHGITASEKINYARELGIEIIVCDHHQPTSHTPECVATLFTDKICAAGISWFLSKNLLSKKLDSYLDLVSIATIADLEPLIGLNRSFVKYGLPILNKTTRYGLLALFEEAGLKPGQIGPYEIGYIIAPRLNAMGRLEHAIESLRLLCTSKSERAKQIATKLGKTNKERQTLTEETTKQAIEFSHLEFQSSKIIVVQNESYNQGIIGLVAGKLVEQFSKPAIVIAKGDKLSKASARSISGFNIIEAIRNFADLLVEVGGHPMAAGFTIETEKINLFKEKIINLANEQIPEELLTKTLKIDLAIPLKLIDLNFWKKINLLSPYGLGNPEPVFTSEVIVKGFKLVGQQNQHLKIIFSDTQDSSLTFNGVGFNLSEVVNNLQVGQRIKIAYNISLNQWNGYQNLELKIKDIKCLDSNN